MNWVVVVGVLIALMFLVSFTSWFYYLASGVNALAVDDGTRGYRLGTWIVGGAMLMGMVFWLNATFQECPTPEEDREGLFKYLDCTIYDWAKDSALAPYLPGPRDVFIDPEQESLKNPS